MKPLIVSALIGAIAFSTFSVYAAGDHAGHGSTSETKAQNQMQMVDAEVKKIDMKNGKVTLSHGPLVNLNMPAMTMVMGVKDPGWLNQMKVGDKIRFMADNVDGALTVVHFESAK